VIARENLGDQIDIHCGGIDHIPIHHTNEIAQTESITGKRFAQIWLHNNHIKIDGTKMSKSLGNVYLLQDLFDKHPNEKPEFLAMAYKLLILSSHYQTEGNFTFEIFEAAMNRLKNWRAVLDREELEKSMLFYDNILSDLCNDLDTVSATTSVDYFIDKISESIEKYDHVITLRYFTELNCILEELLGIKLFSEDIPDSAKALILAREAARNTKDWAKSDEVREQLLADGITVRDTPRGAIWSRT
jgi:cysteinyl-tRNA synthetase